MKITGLSELSDEELFLLHEAAYYRSLFGGRNYDECIICCHVAGKRVTNAADAPCTNCFAYNACAKLQSMHMHKSTARAVVAAVEREMGER